MMEILTDSPDFAGKLLGPLPAAVPPPGGAEMVLAGLLLRKRILCFPGTGFHPLWRHLLITEQAPKSQYDELIGFIRERPALPGGLLCLAGSGAGFHGSDGRPWACGEGNLHLCACLAPGPGAPRRTAAYMVLSVVSLLQALDSPGFGGRASVKWVNDILIEDAKVGGVLVHTQAAGADVTGVVLGFGLNAGTAPQVPRDRFVPRVGSLAEFAADKTACAIGPVLRKFTGILADNYEKLLRGGYRELHGIYAARSAVIGRQVAIYDGDNEVRRGKAVSIGESLELFLEGSDSPVAGGRLVLLS